MINHKRFMQNGFTIVEIMISIFVIGVLATIVTTGYAGYKENTIKAQIATTSDAYVKSLKTYTLEYNSFPKVSTCLPTGAKCCSSIATSVTAVSCGTNTEIAGTNIWATDTTDAKITKYINNQAPTFPVVATFTDCINGLMSNGPCKSTSTLTNVGPAYIANQTGSKYTSDEASVANKGFLVYYVGPTYTCESTDVMTLSSGKLVFNSSATYTRSTTNYRECIVGIKST